jgi:5-methylcytosine-specific restriction enzyme subunit McrC
MVLSGFEYCKFIEGVPSTSGEVVQLQPKTFNNLWNFVLENQGGEDSDKVLTVGKANGVRYIRASKYVGTIQTKDGQIIEILPKIAKGNSEKDKEKARSVFRKMLSSCYGQDARRISDVALETKKDFPIFEYYIQRYLEEVDRLVLAGVKKNYSKVQANEPFLKGKLLISKQITKNAADKAHFQIEYSKYIEDIPQNRIVVSTLHKLSKITSDTSLAAWCHRSIAKLDGIPQSRNITTDLQSSLASNRLFADYANLITWSSQFLLNKGFTSFKGNTVNCALLFDAAKLFESYIAHLFRKYAKDFIVSPQDTSHFLIHKLNDNMDQVEPLFKLRPDLVAKPKDTSARTVILDTKWKTLNDSKTSGISIQDLYQLYAYGHKYTAEHGKHPVLVLIYPATQVGESGTHYLYDLKGKITGSTSFGDNPLGLMVSKFELNATEDDYMHQVIGITLACQDFMKKILNKKQGSAGLGGIDEEE